MVRLGLLRHAEGLTGAVLGVTAFHHFCASKSRGEQGHSGPREARSRCARSITHRRRGMTGLIERPRGPSPFHQGQRVPPLSGSIATKCLSGPSSNGKTRQGSLSPAGSDVMHRLAGVGARPWLFPRQRIMVRKEFSADRSALLDALADLPALYHSSVPHATLRRAS